MSPGSNNRRALALLTTLAAFVLVRTTSGFLDSSPVGIGAGAVMVALSALPLVVRGIAAFRRKRPSVSVGNHSPYRASASIPEESPAPRPIAASVAVDLLCIVLALATWAELQSPEPLQTFPRRTTRAQPCGVVPCMR